MTSRALKARMKDWIVEKLRTEGRRAEPRTGNVVGRIDSTWIEAETGAVLLVDQVYPNGSVEDVYRMLRRGSFPSVAMVLLKDGTTFFRSAAQDKSYKAKYELSLKHYGTDDLHKIIMFRPEEIFVFGNRELVQYFQPDSTRLEEGIASFRFGNVTFDYSHIPSGERFGPMEQDSKKLFIWKQEIFRNGDMRVHEGYVKPLHPSAAPAPASPTPASS